MQETRTMQSRHHLSAHFRKETPESYRPPSWGGLRGSPEQPSPRAVRAPVRGYLPGLASSTALVVFLGCGDPGTTEPAADDAAADDDSTSTSEPEAEDDSSDDDSSDDGDGDDSSDDDSTAPEGCPLPNGDALTAALADAQPAELATTPSDGFDSGFVVLEGPLWLNGELYLSQINNGPDAPPPARVMRYDAATASLVVALPESGSNGLQLTPDGRLAAARHSDGSVAILSLDGSAAPQVLAAQYEGVRFNSPNDLTFHSNGTLFFTDPDWQASQPPPQAAERLYRVPAPGTVEAVAAALTAPSLVRKPNGVTIAGDESKLYVGGQNGLFRFQLDTLAQVGDGVELDVPEVNLGAASQSDGVDGMTTDCNGNLYLASGPRIVVLDAAEQFVGEIRMPGPDNPTNVELGGPSGTLLYITTLEGSSGGSPRKPSLYALDLAAATP